MIRILINDGVDHQLITDQSFLDDPRRQWCRYHTVFFAPLAGALLAPGDPHEVPGGLHTELLTFSVANHCRCLPAAAANALLRRAAVNLLDSRKSGWYPVPTRMAP